MPFVLRCPDCRVKFPYDPTAGFPEFCPNEKCKSHIGLSDKQIIDIPMPFLSSAKNRSVDKVYRDMEKGSEFRAQAAADMVGAPVHEMSALKITDLNTKQKPGDIAAPPISNAVTQVMDASHGKFGFQGANGLGFSGPVASGPVPNAGAKFQSVLREVHGQKVGWDALGDRPALETQQPGYRRRA